MSGIKFGWKKKSHHDIKPGEIFKEASKETLWRSDEEKLAETVDWKTLVKQNKELRTEDLHAKFQRLYDEGAILADEGRFWEAINRWDTALEIIPMNEKLHEMKSQVLMELGEIFPAVQSAKRSVHIKPDWAEAYQTLGRAHLNIGELNSALKSFMKAEFLKPDSPTLWADDVKWTLNLIEQEKQMMQMDTS